VGAIDDVVPLVAAHARDEEGGDKTRVRVGAVVPVGLGNVGVASRLVPHHIQVAPASSHLPLQCKLRGAQRRQLQLAGRLCAGVSAAGAGGLWQ